jgi:hypothetical protein
VVFGYLAGTTPSLFPTFLTLFERTAGAVQTVVEVVEVESAVHTMVHTMVEAIRPLQMLGLSYSTGKHPTYFICLPLSSKPLDNANIVT